MQRRKKQTIIAAVIGTIGLALILTAGWFFGKQYLTLNYENGQYGFTLKYPVNWSFAENKNGAAAIFYSPRNNALDFFQENVNVVVQDLSQNPQTLNEYTTIAIDQMQAVFGINLEILDSSATSIDGHIGHQFGFIGKGPNGDLQYLCRWTIVGTTAYQITYTALASGYERHIKAAERIMGSFRILQ